ncbi:MAG: hypothetical protein ACI841_000144 [Planctomycetota bacterium]|jgi:hypothetical protein
MYPTMYVLDGKGSVQHVNLHGKALDSAIAKLIAETKTAAK